MGYFLEALTNHPDIAQLTWIIYKKCRCFFYELSREKQ